jgi:hypothetical protein
MADGSGSIIRFLVLMSAVLLFVSLSLVSYSTSGYTLVKYPRTEGAAVVCVEGEVQPTNQTITVINDGDAPTMNPYVIVNGIGHEFNMSVSDKGYRQRTDALVLGCNNVTYGADTETQFKVKLEYLSHWRPVVKYLEIGNLQVGHSTRYFISAEEPDKRPVEASRLNITDITRDVESPVFYAEFNGSGVRYKMEEPGNYKADMQVYDGYVWSDVYEVGFTSHVITTEEQKKAYRLYELQDDPVAENPGIIPPAVKPGDNDGLKMAKRAINGAYLLVRRTADYVKGNLPYGDRIGLRKSE